MVLSPLLRHLYQNHTRTQPSINPATKHGTVIATQGNGVFGETSTQGVTLGAKLGAGVVTTVSPLGVVPLGVIGADTFERELVMAEVDLKVCVLFIEDPVCARGLAPALYANGATAPHRELRRGIDSSLGRTTVNRVRLPLLERQSRLRLTPSYRCNPPDSLWTISEKQREEG